jgi:hypothetical protein
LVAQENRLPLQVRVILVLNGGRRSSSQSGQAPIRLMTKVALPIFNPLNFATKGS